MTVHCITNKSKADIFDEFAKGLTKNGIAVSHGISARTVGRVLEEFGGGAPERDRKNPPQGDLPLDDNPDVFDEVEDDLHKDNGIYNYVVASRYVVLVRVEDGHTDTRTVQLGDRAYGAVIDKLDGYPENPDAIAEAFEMLDVATYVKSNPKTVGSITVYPEDNMMVHTDSNGREHAITGSLTDRVVDACQSDDELVFQGLCKFTEKVLENPSRNVVQELYDFLVAKDIDISAGGNVVCYKRVRSNYTDVHSGTFDNSPGSTVAVNRWEVDEDSNQMCSYGLHVCSAAYLPSFAGERVIRVEVHPKDFVSVPHDYYSIGENGSVRAKARVCEYRVVEDITDSYSV